MIEMSSNENARIITKIAGFERHKKALLIRGTDACVSRESNGVASIMPFRWLSKVIHENNIDKVG